MACDKFWVYDPAQQGLIRNSKLIMQKHLNHIILKTYYQSFFPLFRYINKVLIIIDQDLRDGLRMSRKRNRNLENNGWINIPNTNYVGRCKCHCCPI